MGVFSWGRRGQYQGRLFNWDTVSSKSRHSHPAEDRLDDIRLLGKLCSFDNSIDRQRIPVFSGLSELAVSIYWKDNSLRNFSKEMN